MLAPISTKNIENIQTSEDFFFIAMCGIPGTGKTTVAHLLADNFGFPVVPPDQYRTERKYYPQISSQESDFCWFDTARRCGNGSRAAILDATFHTYPKRKILYNYNQKNVCRVLFINIEAESAILHDRLEKQCREGEKFLHSSVSTILKSYQSSYVNPAEDPEKPSLIRINSVSGKLRVINESNHSIFQSIRKFLEASYCSFKPDQRVNRQEPKAPSRGL